MHRANAKAVSAKVLASFGAHLTGAICAGDRPTGGQGGRQPDRQKHNRPRESICIRNCGTQTQNVSATRGKQTEGAPCVSCGSSDRIAPDRLARVVTAIDLLRECGPSELRLRLSGDRSASRDRQTAIGLDRPQSDRSDRRPDDRRGVAGAEHEPPERPPRHCGRAAATQPRQSSPAGDGPEPAGREGSAQGRRRRSCRSRRLQRRPAR